MICKSCGKELPDDTQFCIQCGKDPTAEAVPEATATASPAPTEPKPAKKPLNKKVLIGIAAGVVVLLIIIIAAASGGGKGNLKGEWVPVSGSGSYESLKFSGSNVTLDSGYGGAMTGKYTYKNNTLTVTVQGYPIELPLEMGRVGKVDVLLIGGVKYAHPKDKAKVADADANGEGNFEINDNPTEAANNTNNADPIFEQFAKLPKVTVAHKVVGSTEVSGYEIRGGRLYKTGWGAPEEPILENAKLIRVAGRTYFVVKANGELWGVGGNENGVLGDGTGVDRQEPVKITDNVVDMVGMVFVGTQWRERVYAIKSDNTLWRWGRGTFAPEQVAADIAELIREPGYDDKGAIYLKTNGDIVMNDQVVLNNVKEVLWQQEGNTRVILKMSDNAAYDFPSLFNNANSLENTKVYDKAKSVTVSWTDGYIIVTDSGELMGKGDNSQGQFGDGTKVPKTDWVKLADGVASYGEEYTHENTRYNYHYIKTDGSVWAWTSADPTAKQVVPPTTTVGAAMEAALASAANTTAEGGEGFPTLPDPS